MQEEDIKKRCFIIDSLIILVYVVRICVEWIVDFIFSFIYKQESNIKIPGIKQPLLLKSASVLAEEIREKKVIPLLLLLF